MIAGPVICPARQFILKMRTRTSHRPRQGQELNDGEQRDAIRLIQLMPVPERNSQRTIRVRYLRAAFRDRSASGDVLISLSEMPSDNSIVWIMLRYLGDCSL